MQFSYLNLTIVSSNSKECAALSPANWTNAVIIPQVAQFSHLQVAYQHRITQKNKISIFPTEHQLEHKSISANNTQKRNSMMKMGYLHLRQYKTFKKKKFETLNESRTHLAATSIPQINTVAKTNSQDIGQRPIHKIQIKIVLQSRCIQNLPQHRPQHQHYNLHQFYSNRNTPSPKKKRKEKKLTLYGDRGTFLGGLTGVWLTPETTSWSSMKGERECMDWRVSVL